MMNTLSLTELVKLGTILKEKNQVVSNMESIKYFQKAIEIPSEDSFLKCLIHEHLGDLYQRSGEMKKSIVQYNVALKCIENVEGEESRRRKECLTNEIGDCLLKRGKYQKVVQFCTLNLRTYPNNSHLYRMRGESFFRLKNFKSSSEDLKRASDLGCENVGDLMVRSLQGMNNQVKKQNEALKEKNKELELRFQKEKGLRIEAEKRFDESKNNFESSEHKREEMMRSGRQVLQNAVDSIFPPLPPPPPSRQNLHHHRQHRRRRHHVLQLDNPRRSNSNNNDNNNNNNDMVVPPPPPVRNWASEFSLNIPRQEDQEEVVPQEKGDSDDEVVIISTSSKSNKNTATGERTVIPLQRHQPPKKRRKTDTGEVRIFHQSVEEEQQQQRTQKKRKKKRKRKKKKKRSRSGNNRKFSKSKKKKKRRRTSEEEDEDEDDNEEEEEEVQGIMLSPPPPIPPPPIQQSQEIEYHLNKGTDTKLSNNSQNRIRSGNVCCCSSSCAKHFISHKGVGRCDLGKKYHPNNDNYFYEQSCGGIWNDKHGSYYMRCRTCLENTNCFEPTCGKPIVTSEDVNCEADIGFCDSEKCNNSYPFFHLSCVKKKGLSYEVNGNHFYFCSSVCLRKCPKKFQM